MSLPWCGVLSPGSTASTTSRRPRPVKPLGIAQDLNCIVIGPIVRWMTNDSEGLIGCEICLLDSASKGKSGRRIPLNEDVRNAPIEYRDEVGRSERPTDMSHG